MKHYKPILYTLIGLLLATLAVFIYFAFENAKDNQRRDKAKAERLLKSTAEAWVSKEIDRLDTPIFFNKETSLRPTKRSLIIAEGEFIVEVDSIKEKKLLFSLEYFSSAIQYLFLVEELSLDTLNSHWQMNLNEIIPNYHCALELISTIPVKKQKLYSGNLSIRIPSNYSDSYYLDEMYYLELHTYLFPPSIWKCINWQQPVLVITAVILLLLIGILFYFTFWGRRKKEIPFFMDDIVQCIAKDVYQIQDIIFDKEKMTITFRESIISCPAQSFRLLSSFINAKNHFLSKTQIAEICDWKLGDIGVNEKRRTAMFQLRKLLYSKESHVNLKSGKNVKGEDGFFLLIED